MIKYFDVSSSSSTLPAKSTFRFGKLWSHPMDIESQSSSRASWLLKYAPSFGLTRLQRYSCAVFCLFMCMVSFSFAFFHLPLVAVFPRQFILPLVMGVVLFLCGVGFVVGVEKFVTQGLASKTVLPVSIVNVCFLIGSLYSSLVAQSYVLSLVFSILQIVGLFVWIASAFPGGLSMCSSIGRWIWGSFIKSMY